MLLRVPVFLALMATLALPCLGGEPRNYAVLSIVGDRLLVAGPRASVGKPAAPPTYIELGDPAIDAAVLRTVHAAVTRTDAGAKTTLLLPRNPALFASETKALDETRDVRAVFAAIRPLLGEIPATHLILVSKLRHEARMRFADAYVDTSAGLEGAGFYVDAAKRVANANTGEVEYGYLGLFAYFKVSLFDLGTGELLREEEVVASTVHRDPAKTPWDGMSGEDKVRVLKLLIASEVDRAAARILK